jgi:D-xylulose reductase
VEDRPVPEISDPHDVIVQISYVGVCGSDVHFWTRGGIGNTVVSAERPITMGHEASGIIDSVGAAVTSVKPGDHVALEPGVPCRRCKSCKSGWYNRCRYIKFAAAPAAPDKWGIVEDCHGTLSRLWRTQADFCYKIPEHIRLDEAVLVEPLAVAVHAVRQAGVRPGDAVVITGSGTIGLFCALVAREFGAKKLLISDIQDAKLEFANRFLGPSCATFKPDLTATAEDNAGKIRTALSLEDGADIALECSGAESSLQTSIFVLGMGGTYVQVGLGKPVQGLPVIVASEKEITFKGCFRYAEGDFTMAVDMIASGKVPVKELISSEVEFERATEAWERTRKGKGIKNLIRGPTC